MLCSTFDRLDAVVLEERIAEARGIRAGYRCLALLHRAEAAVARRSVTIFAAVFTGAHCSWCKQSTQCNRDDQCRSGYSHCFQHGGGHLNLLSPRLPCVLFDPRAQRARVKAGKSRQIAAKERRRTRAGRSRPASDVEQSWEDNPLLPPL